MNKFKTLWFLIAAAVCVPFFSTHALAQQQRSEQDEMPATIALKGVDGKTYDLAQMHGDVVLVSFGATWCSPCAAELRALEELKKEYKNKPVKFLWISIESPTEVSDKDLRDYAKATKFTFPVLRDPTKFTYAQFSTRVRIPLVLLYDKEGNLVARQFGMNASPEEYKTHLRARFDKLLAAQAGGGKTISAR